MITILPGFNKDNQQETFKNITLVPGNIYSVVGPTGSGKTQLLDDIERLNPGDGVSRRRVISDKHPSIHHLSQKMHYMVDMPVKEFILLYGESIGEIDVESYSQRIINKANTLCGEAIKSTDQLTRLSGGQSRALMIATVAMNADSDIVLLDEIENAGINRLEVLETLRTSNKIVIMITHDPLLALQADYRLVLKNGGIQSVIPRNVYEEFLSQQLYSIDQYISQIRSSLREGHTINEEDSYARFTME